ncbi:MAG TPA: hypothetical protein VHZ07_14570 [Bryobacteraceae bacterium]|nr:hypothetical protein [Bryobacteraceae bacterium]
MHDIVRHADHLKHLLAQAIIERFRDQADKACDGLVVNFNAAAHEIRHLRISACWGFGYDNAQASGDSSRVSKPASTPKLDWQPISNDIYALI